MLHAEASSIRADFAVFTNDCPETSLAVLNTRRGNQQVAIREVHGEHIRLLTPIKPKAGEAIILKTAGGSRAGRVLWVDRTECGITFRENLTLAQVRNIQKRERY